MPFDLRKLSYLRWKRPLLTLAPVAVTIAAVLIFTRSLLDNPSHLGAHGDIRYFHFLWEVARKTWADFGQMPLWNPYYCGGMVELANVQSMALAPTTLLALVTDAGTGMRIHIILHFMIAFGGMVAWARYRKLGPVWSYAPALVFTMAGFFAERATGHVSFMAFAWLPWVLLCYEASGTARRYAYIGGGVIAFTVYDGSPYATALAIALVMLLVAADMGQSVLRKVTALFFRGPSDTPQAPVPHAAFMRGLLFAVGFVSIAAFKLFPVMEFLELYPRAIPQGDDSLSWIQMWHVFMHRALKPEVATTTYVFGEYRDYIGPFVLCGAMFAMVLRRVRIREVAIVALCLGLMAGHHGAWSPYGLLHKLPVFSSLRVPARFAIIVLPFLGLWFGQGLAALADRRFLTTRQEITPQLRRRYGLRLSIAMTLFFAATVDLFTINATMLEGFFNTPVPAQRLSSPEAFHQVAGGGGAQWRAPLENRGYVACYEPNKIKSAPSLQHGPTPQLEIVPTNAGTGSSLHFSPNEVEVTIDMQQHGIIVLNQNFYPGWKVAICASEDTDTCKSLGAAFSHRGRIGASVPAGSHHVRFTFRPRAMWAFAVITLLGLLGIVVALLLPKSRTGRAPRKVKETARLPWTTQEGERLLVLFAALGFLWAKLANIAVLLLPHPDGGVIKGLPTAFATDALVLLAIAAVGATLRKLMTKAGGNPALPRGMALGGILVGLYATANHYFVEVFGGPISQRYMSHAFSLGDDGAGMIDTRALWHAVILMGLFLLSAWMSHRFVVGWRPPWQRAARKVYAGAAVYGVLGLGVMGFAGDQSHTLAQNALMELGKSHPIDKVGQIPGQTMDHVRDDLESLPSPGEAWTAPIPWNKDAKPPKHVVLWLGESIATRRMHLYGGPLPTTPNLDRLRHHSLRFDNYYTNSPVSIKAIFNTMCGMLPYPAFEFITQLRPRIECDSLMEVLDRAGWDAALVHGGYFSFTDKLSFLGQRGFDFVADAKMFLRKSNYFRHGAGVDDQALVDQTLEWQDSRADPETPSFLLAIPIIPHHPYPVPDGVPQPFGDSSDVDRYHNGLLYTDALFGAVYEAYKERGLADDTLFIFMGDHGQAFHEHPGNRLHGSFVFEENVHSPLVFMNDRLFPNEIVSKRIGSHVDLLPTILEILQIPDEKPRLGQSLIKPDFTYRPAIFGTYYQGHLMGLRDGNWKSIWNQDSNRLQLFDLEIDPGEKYNRAADNPWLVQRHTEIMRRVEAWQRTAIVGTIESAPSYLEQVVRNAVVTLVDAKGKVTQTCDSLREEPLAWTCGGQAAWMNVGVQKMSVYGVERDCIHAHPPQSGAMRIEVPGPINLPSEIGSGLSDGGRRAGGTPLNVKWTFNESSTKNHTVTNKRSFVSDSLEFDSESGSMTVEISSRLWNNRSTCLVMTP